MYWIEPHNDPEILKLGFGSMALYGEKNADRIDYPEASDRLWYAIRDRWEIESRIAYLKEPEWKAGDGVYHKGDNDNNEWSITEIRDGYIYLKRKGIFKREKASNLSRYYPGQQVESFKYVREMTDYQKMTKVYSWQEVEEPEDVLFKFGSSIKSHSPQYIQFQADKEQAKILAEINT